MAVARKCEKCGRIDARVTWSSEADAAKDPVFETWVCPNCAWPEFDLEEVEAATAKA